jgi:DNA-binding transcriptional regulator GbsR (MarR family)
MTDFEQSLVALGISAATAFSLPKSVGALYGLAFARAEPLAFDDFLEALEMSKGSVSQGLKFLTRMGALRAVYDLPGSKVEGRRSKVPLSRKTFYEPELSLRRLLIGILNENVLPHLQTSGEAVEQLRGQLNGVPKEHRKLLEHRLETLEGWGKKTRMLWPLAERVLSGPLKRAPRSSTSEEGKKEKA